MNRRKLLKNAAWAVPVIATAVAAPLAAASVTEKKANRIKFTNVTATVGAKANSVYINTKLRVIDGPAPVEDAVVIVTVNGTPHTLFAGHLLGWGSSQILRLEVPGLPKTPVQVDFYAEARGCEAISARVDVAAPGWWA